MATTPLGAESAPLNMPQHIDDVFARDAEFWRLHAEWRFREDAVELDVTDEDAVIEALVGYADEVLLPMMARGVTTATALAAKLEAVAYMGDTCLGRECLSGVTFFDVIRWDAERLVKREMFGGSN